MIKEEIVLGKPYKVRRVGDKVWMVENLNYSSIAAGDSWAHGEYGRLYTWDAAMSLSAGEWVVPSSADWREMKKLSKDEFNPQLGGVHEQDGNLYMVGDMGCWWMSECSSRIMGRDVWWDKEDGFQVNSYESPREIGQSVRLVRPVVLSDYSDQELLDELVKRGYVPDPPGEKVLKRTIVDPLDLFKYSIALVNSGVTYESIEVLERQILPLLFGVDGAERLLEYLAENTTEEKTEPLPTDDTYDFSGSTEVPRIIYNYGEVDELIKGDGKLFAGLKALLATLICTNLLSQNRVQVARQNVTKQPVNSRQTNRKEDSEVVQALCFTAHSIICALARFLKKEGKNPLDLNVDGIIEATRYSVNVSGKMPSNWLNIWGWF